MPAYETNELLVEAVESERKLSESFLEFARQAKGANNVEEAIPWYLKSIEFDHTNLSLYFECVDCLVPSVDSEKQRIAAGLLQKAYFIAGKNGNQEQKTRAEKGLSELGVEPEVRRF